MDHKTTAEKAPGLRLNDVKVQSNTQNGAVVLAKLQQKVARLEIMLQDKESELSKLHSSSKTSHVNELKIQTEMYYQEVLRLKNQLNLFQESKLSRHSRLSPIEEPSNGRTSKKNSCGKMDDDLSKVGKTVRKSVEKLKEENDRLSSRLVSIQSEKERLSLDFQKVLREADERERTRNQCNENATQTSPKHNVNSSTCNSDTPVTPVPPEESLALLKSQIEELRMRERAWEQERATYRELVMSLKEDRVFFKDSSQKRHDELWALQTELLKLQKEIGEFHLNGKPLCKQCTKPPYRQSKASKKSSAKDTTITSRSSIPTSRPNSGSSVNASVGDKPPKPKPASVVSTKRLPTSPKPSKPLRKEGYRSNPSKSSVSSTSSSPLSSTQNSPSHGPAKRSKPPFQSSRKGISRTSSSRSAVSDKISSNNSAVESRSFSGSSASVEKDSGGKSPSASPLRDETNLNQSEDEKIAQEILRDLDLSFLGDAVARKRRDTSTNQEEENANNDTGLPSSQSSQTHEEENRDGSPSRKEVSSPEESGCGDCRDADHEAEDRINEAGVKDIISLLEAHFNRKAKLQELLLKNKEAKKAKLSRQKSGPSKSSESASSPVKSPKKPSRQSTPKKPANISPSKSKSPTKITTKAILHTQPKSPKKSPPKPALKKVREVTESTPHPSGEEPQNMKDIDEMICLLEGHIARKAFISLKGNGK